MGNVGGKKLDESGPSRTKNEEEEEYMDCVHGGARVSYHAPGPFPESIVQAPPHSPWAYQSHLMFTPQFPAIPSQRPDELMHIQSIESIQNTKECMLSENGISTMITWSHDGEQVAVEGSWDNWKKREFLQRSSGKDFSIMKVLQSGVYQYRFIVDGISMCDPDLPRLRDDMGNMFNILDLQDYVPQVLNNIFHSDSPPSPISSYDNSSFSTEDFNQKMPELPLLLQQTLVDHPSSSQNSPVSPEKSSAAVLNHLYIQKGHSGHSVLALSSTQRFRKKYVTLVLYKSMK